MRLEPDPLVVSGANVSLAWGKAFLFSLEYTGRPKPIIINFDGFSGGVIENPAIRQAVNTLLADQCLESVGNTASTIFPYRIWRNRGMPRDVFFRWYQEILYPRIRRRRRANQYGVYFYRMINFVGSKGNQPGGQSESINQLEYVISCFLAAKARGSGIRNSALQVACFDPLKDDTRQVMRGFPCLQQVGFTYSGNELSVHAFYPTEYIVDRGYGNYLGLSHLGLFMAEQMGLEFRNFYCYIGHPVLGKVNKHSLKELASVVRKELELSDIVPGASIRIPEDDSASEGEVPAGREAKGDDRS